MSNAESQLVPTVTQSHTVAYRTLLVMLCVLKFYFVDFYGMFTSSPIWRLKNACALQSREKCYYSKQNITSSVL